MVMLAAAVFSAGESLAGSGVSISCTNCKFGATGDGTEFTVGQGKMPGHRFGVVYCMDCRKFESVDLVNRKQLQDLVAGYEAHLANSDLSQSDKKRYTFLRDNLKPEIAKRTENPLLCPKCARERKVVELKDALAGENKGGIAIEIPCPKCEKKSLVIKDTGLCWD